MGCVTGSFVWSPLTDRFGRKGIFALVMAGAGLGSFGLLFFLNSGIANMAAMLAVVFCMGIFAASTPVMESSLAEHYRPDMRGIGPGIVSTFSSVGRFCGPLLAALVMMALGSTQSYLYFSGGAAIVCSLAILIMVRKTGGIYGDPLAEKALREQGWFGGDLRGALPCRRFFPKGFFQRFKEQLEERVLVRLAIDAVRFLGARDRRTLR